MKGNQSSPGLLRRFGRGRIAAACFVLAVGAYTLKAHRTPATHYSTTASSTPDIMFDSLWKYTAKDIEGNDLALSTFSGKVGLVVNTATY